MKIEHIPHLESPAQRAFEREMAAHRINANLAQQMGIERRIIHLNYRVMAVRPVEERGGQPDRGWQAWIGSDPGSGFPLPPGWYPTSDRDIAVIGYALPEFKPAPDMARAFVGKWQS